MEIFFRSVRVCKMLLMYVWCLLLFLPKFEQRFLKASIYQKIRQTTVLSRFLALLELNRPAKLNLQYGEMTIFAPTNEAFEWYTSGQLYDVTNYHMTWYAKTVEDLKDGPLTSLVEDHPPVWVTKINGETYVNNARIIPELSNYITEVNTEPKKKQVLHVVDEVLNPVVRRAPLVIVNPTAYDLLVRSQFWDLGGAKVQQFYRAVVNNQQEGAFKSGGSSTFFIPVDEFISDYSLSFMDSDTISSHIVPNRVLFTRPTPKNIPYETLSSADTFYVVVILTGELTVRSHILVGDTKHPVGEVAAEIVKANIPVRNGVVHLIKRPLVVTNNRLTLFPFLSIIDKLESDPTLSKTHRLGIQTEFNTLLENGSHKLTYFVPRNQAWSHFAQYLEANETFVSELALKYGKSILSRHLIISNVSYTIEDLQRRSNTSDTADINIRTAGGILQVGIGEHDGKYVIYWRDKFIPIYRANWMCNNGIVHVVDDIFVTKEDISLLENQREPSPNPLKLLNVVVRVLL